MSDGVAKLFRAQIGGMSRQRATPAAVATMQNGLAFAQSVHAEEDKE